ncbi:MAG: DUF4262 domain-containing protein [Acidimicrobiales bacterium]
MCWECDNPGGDYAAHMLKVIDRFGWGVGGVEASPNDPGWLHTIGLPVTLGHPELLMQGATGETHAVLDAIAAYIRDSGRTISAGETMGLGEHMITFGAVSRQRRRRGELASSEEVLARLGFTKVTAIEVLGMPAELQQCSRCFDESLRQWLSDGPDAA